MIEQIGRSQSAKFGFVQHVKHMTKTTNLRQNFILRIKPIQDLTETGQRRYMCDFVSKKISWALAQFSFLSFCWALKATSEKKDNAFSSNKVSMNLSPTKMHMKGFSRPNFPHLKALSMQKSQRKLELT